MQVNRWCTGLFMLILCASCIEKFEPDIEETDGVLVINGMITDIPGLHTVTVSMSAPYNDPHFEPVAGCVVRVEDEAGTGITFEEDKPGTYQSNLDQDFLATGKTYKLLVFTPDGNEYQSDYDSLLACPPIEGLSFKEEVQGTSNPLINYYGIRFLVDVSGGDNESRNYLWTFEETWEYASTYFTQYIWDGEILIEFVPFDDSAVICYFTRPVIDLYVGSTKSLTSNRLSEFPIHYVSNRTPRLRRRYSLLVFQHSLSERSFTYWDQMRTQTGETGGLFETQPSSITGNIFNINDPEEKVLGFFFASQVQEKRINIKKNDFSFPVADWECPLDTISQLGELHLDYPYHLYSISEFGRGAPYIYSDRVCHDCRLRGGYTTRPEYWEY